jgi:signal transduction histidine kinase
MFSNGVAKVNWVQKVKSELLTMSKEIYNRSADLVIDLEAVEIQMNQEYLQRMILELVDNALKYSKPGQKVHVRGTKVEEEYVIEVIDNGRGFRIASLDDIAAFKQYNRKKFEQQGLGIGLYLVKRLVDFNQGQLKITSLEGEGTRITIEVPIGVEAEYSRSYELYNQA